MARPVPTVTGSPLAVVAGRGLRCHEWVDGEAKVNEQTTVEESGLMGAVVAHLHGLSLGWDRRLDYPLGKDEEPSWAGLLAEAERGGSVLALLIREHRDALERFGEQARRLRVLHRGLARIGSHRDLNAHNVLFANRGLCLIDWEAAGPVFPPWERANCATLWASRADRHYDIDAVTSFYRAYIDAGGDISVEDPDTLEFLVENVEAWTRQNVRWALEAATPDQDHWASTLTGALLDTPTTIEDRRRLLRAAISRLDRAP